MTSDQQSKHVALGIGGDQLQVAIANYAAKATALAAAQTAAAAAQTQLDAAYTAFVAADTAFGEAFPLPAGYTPPV